MKSIAKVISLGVFLSMGVVANATADRERGEDLKWNETTRAGIAPVDNETYLQECGSCHFAYPPGFLPPQSWEKLMGSMHSHFGENVELSRSVRGTLYNYLLNNSAVRSNFEYSNKIMQGLGNNPAPLRITETHYFIRKHDELTPQMVAGNPEVVSFSNCAACHSKASEGSFKEDEVVIPGYGRYED
jgi:hypothetical protein